MRSSSFRQNSLSQTPQSGTSHNLKSPTLPPLSPTGDTIPDIYRKQATRIDELENENRRLEKDFNEGQLKWQKTEEELEDFREANSEVAQLKDRAEKAEAKALEVEKLVCEVSASLLIAR